MKTSAFQQAIESVESLPLEDKKILLDILQKRLLERRRTNLSQEVSEIKQEFAFMKRKIWLSRSNFSRIISTMKSLHITTTS